VSHSDAGGFSGTAPASANGRLDQRRSRNRRISRTPATHQIAIEPAAAACSAFGDFVYCRFADAGRRRVWLRSPMTGIRKPLQLLARPRP
jgi:hypothetical protein